MPKFIEQFNKYAKENKSLLQKALTSATNVGEGLIPEHLEEIITNTIVRLSPELAMITQKFDNQKFHEYNRITALPAAGGAMGEAAVTPTRNSTYARESLQLKIIRRKGAVTNFLQDTSANYVDAAAAEMENHLLAHTYDLATYILYGNKVADQYAFDGLDLLVQTNRTNEAAGGVVPTTLGFLDTMIDENIRRQGMRHKQAFLMSPKMLSKISSLLTNVRLNQGLSAGGLSKVDINGGWRMNAYRDIPIIVSNAMRPTQTMGTITAAHAGSGSGITDDQWFFQVSVVTYDGESMASAEINDTTSTSDTLTLSFSAVTGALFYKIYCGTTTGSANLNLVRVVPAFTYDGAGTITGSTASYVFSADPNVADTTVPTALQTDKPLVATGGVPPEVVALWDLDEYQGLGKLPYTNTAGSKFGGLVTIKPLAETDDNLPFLLKSYCALCPSFEATSSWHRGLRVA